MREAREDMQQDDVLARFKKDVKKFSEILQFSKYKGQVSMEVLAKGKNNIKSLKNNIKIIND